MMVDDEITTMNVLKTFLKESGFNRFALIEKPTEAMAELENFRPDLLLLDLVMPEVSGFEILQNVRELEKFENLPIIILTSSSDKKDKLLALAMGATDFLAKPIAPSELQLLVTNTLAAKVYVDQLKSMEQERLQAGYAGIAAIAHWLKGGGALWSVSMILQRRQTDSQPLLRMEMAKRKSPN